MKPHIILLAIATAALIARPAIAADPPDVEVREDIEYGAAGGEKLLLDLAAPKGLDRAVPGLIFIHGGGWTGGGKEAFIGQVKNVATHGYVTVTIDYRLAPKHLFPAQVEDCKCAVRWMRAHAKELNIDPDRIGAIGGSAGGHLAMMLGTMDKDDGLEGEGGWAEYSSKVQAVVSYFGPTNLLGDYPPRSQEIVRQFIGGGKEEREADYRLASPITHVTADDAPMLLFQGTKDSLVPFDQAVVMAAALSDAAVPGRIEILVGRDHGWGGTEMVRTSQAALAFFAEVLGKP